MRVHGLVIVLMVLGMGGLGCKEPAPGGGGQSAGAAWRALNPEQLTAAQAAQVAKAEQAYGALASQLGGELMAALQGGHLPSAITVCGQKAPAIAKSVSESQSVRLGRTSFLVRNPGNAPPGWAKDHVDSRNPARAVFASGDGTIGMLQPIRLAGHCLMCHGPREQIKPEVLARLQQHYPSDQATGFKSGELRGYFWVEVPAR